MAENHELVLYNVFDLLDKNYYIDSYQRGYRWKEEQVKILLDDIWDFVLKKKKRELGENEFYCLQPIVVKAKLVEGGNFFEVIDGQQRLTTLKIILQYFAKNHLPNSFEESYKKPQYTVTYNTRKSSESFLENIGQQTTDSTESNIDYHFISVAYEEVVKWFRDKDYSEKNSFLEVLLAKNDFDNPVKVIWYEVESRENSYDIFTRLNIGKIKLTNAELIKALFLKKWDKKEEDDFFFLRQIQIAKEWDEIENQLKDDSFWYFISNNKLEYENRIEFVFDLLADWDMDKEEYHTFLYFNKFFQESRNENKTPNIYFIWSNIKDVFSKFKEWFLDTELYHYVGYLVYFGASIKEILNITKDYHQNLIISKKQFVAHIRFLVKTNLNLTKKQLRELEYDNKKELRKVFILFNIETLLSTDKAKSKFPFDLLNKQKWDIEHVRSQTDKIIIKEKDIFQFSQDILTFFTGNTCISGFNNAITDISDDRLRTNLTYLLKILDSKDYEKDSFQEVYMYFSKYFFEDKNKLGNGIANLTLLDSYTNRSYKNAFFPIKRNKIQENDMFGIFIPIATKNLFMKFYSKKVDNGTQWTEKDGVDYINSIEETLGKFWS